MSSPNTQQSKWVYAEPITEVVFTVTSRQWAMIESRVKTAKEIPREWFSTFGWAAISAGTGLILAALFDPEVDLTPPPRLVVEGALGVALILSGAVAILASKRAREEQVRFLDVVIDDMHSIAETYLYPQLETGSSESTSWSQIPPSSQTEQPTTAKAE